MTHFMELTAPFYDRCVIEPLWTACFEPRGDSLYSRHRYLIDLIKQQKYADVTDTLKKAPSRELLDPLLLRNILAQAFYMPATPARTKFISYMLDRKPIIYLTKLLPYDVRYRTSEGFVDYRSIITEAGHEDTEIQDQIIAKFGIELVVAGNLIQDAINYNRHDTIRRILQKDKRFSKDEIESIILLTAQEADINKNMIKEESQNQIKYSYRKGDEEKIGLAIKKFLELRDQKTSLTSKMSLLPTYTMHMANKIDDRTYAGIAVAGLAYLAYNRM